jgi:hypothetical protein
MADSGQDLVNELEYALVAEPGASLLPRSAIEEANRPVMKVLAEAPLNHGQRQTVLKGTSAFQAAVLECRDDMRAGS